MQPWRYFASCCIIQSDFRNCTDQSNQLDNSLNWATVLPAVQHIL